MRFFKRKKRISPEELQLRTTIQDELRKHDVELKTAGDKERQRKEKIARITGLSNSKKLKLARYLAKRKGEQ
jgi:hypothetical protein